MKFIHMTDLHLPSPGAMLFGLDPFERAGRCLDDIARWHADAEFCVISGDLAEKGGGDAYRWLAERLKGFPLRTIVMIGNHDDREALCAAFPEARRDGAGFLQSALSTSQGTFLFLDTYKGEGSAGTYCAVRREWLDGQLRAARGRPVWMFMHHPPFEVGMPYMDRIRMEEPDAFAEVLSGHTNIRHIFFGHIHRACYVNWNGISCTSLPGTNHQLPLVREAVATSYSVEPPMYGVVRIGDRQTTIHFDACLDRKAADMPPRSDKPAAG